MTIISTSGLIGSGKDTVADYLISHYNFTQMSFAGALKDAIASIFNWDREMLEGSTVTSRTWREQEDAWWTARLNRSITPRLMLQEWGTEVCRDGFHNEIWLASLENKLKDSTANIIISDCRFPNELDTIKRLGGASILVNRGDKPIWYDHAIKVNAGQKRIGWSNGKHYLKTLNIHPSEYSLIGATFDYTIDNNGTFEELHSNVDNIMAEIAQKSASKTP